MTERIQKTITACVTHENALSPDITLWREPLVGFLDARDTGLQSLKENASKDHLLPKDVLQDAKSVVCFFIPFTDAVMQSNVTDEIASREWALAYIRTNSLIAKISASIESVMANDGYRVGKIPATHNFDEKTLISKWSHRHLAYLAGLGSFGLNNMLITDSGCCGRLGSIVTNYPVEQAVSRHKERCLYKLNGSCGVCVKRCVNEALSKQAFDRFACYDLCRENAEYHKDIGYADVCGKCLVGLPCSHTDPS